LCASYATISGMSVAHFADRLVAAVRRVQNPVLVGLDPRAESLPPGLVRGDGLEATARGYVAFCRGVIDVVAPLVAAVKPQAAFFEQLGPAGCVALADVMKYAASKGLLVILDGKRNDIGSTAQGYAEAYLGPGDASPWGADALTVSPYLGDDSLTPFVDVAQARSAGIFVLVKTSNPGGRRFQDIVANGQPMYRHVADYVESLAKLTRRASEDKPTRRASEGATKLTRRASEGLEGEGREGEGREGEGREGEARPYGLVGAVVGATYPQQLAELRQAMPHTWFLIPGFGAQGGTAQDCAAAFDEHGLGAIVNNSRGIIFAHARKDLAAKFGPGRWQEAVEAATREMIDQLRAETPAGRL
jgi:orotidine-5'-phosphate decarboxylase